MYLEVTFQDLDNIELQQRSLDARLLKVLRVWKEDKGEGATVGILMKACDKAKVGGAAKTALLNR